MQPLYLRICGFGPFLNAELSRETFEIINRERLFLVSGEIGAGKTTLFDAIVYALFGETSFPERSPTDLISQLLPQSSSFPPEVVFEFLLQNRIFRLIRRPKFGAFSSSVSLWIDGKLYANREKEVKEKIRELFGLAGPQFKKVFIIPQGEYRRILLAKPEEKKALFESLFDTKILSDFLEYFEKTLKEKEAELRELINRERELLKISEAETVAELRAKLENVKAKKDKVIRELASVSQKSKEVEVQLKEIEALSKLQEELERAREDLRVLEENRDHIEKLKGDIHLLRRLKEREFHYERARKLWLEIRRKKEEERAIKSRLHLISEYLAELKEKLKSIQQREEEIEKLKEEIRLFEELLNKQMRRKDLLNKIEVLKDHIFSLERQLEDLSKREEETRRELESLIEEAQKFRRFREIKVELEKIEEELSFHEDYLKGKELLLEFLDRLSLLTRERDNIKRELERLKDETLAVFLAQKLRKGEPCPVCGSTEHPKKASPTLWQEAFIKDLERKLEEKEDQLKRTEETVHKVRGKLELLESKLKRDRTDLIERKSELEKALISLEIKTFRFKDPAQYENRERELRSLLEEIHRQRDNLRQRVEELRNKQALIEGELKGLFTGNIDSEPDLEVLEKSILERKIEVDTFMKKKEETEREAGELEKERLQLETQLKSHIRYLSEIVADYRDSFREIIKLVREGLFSNLKELKRAWEELKNLARYEEEVSSYEERYQRLRQRFELLQEELDKFLKEKGEEFLKNLASLREELQTEKDKLERLREELNRELGKAENTLLQLEYIERTLLELDHQKRKLDEEYSLLKHLTDVLSGKPKGVSFHSYVLSKFLTLILRRANFYFREFTSGRFNFVEGEIFTRGFILEVFDSYTGQKRELKTLSGGESFLASLAFALGTSDILLRLSRKPPLETILIDEGFGSLDETSLEKVTDTLVNVSQRSGKIIGLISHLREMKERIPLVIEIIKTKDRGSIIQRIRRNF